MPTKQQFEILYDANVFKQLASIERRYYGLIERTITQQLRHEPDLETRNRKPLLRPSVFAEAWELRFGPGNRFRVFYGIDAEVSQVHILAIGLKVGRRLFVGGEEFEL